VPAKFVKNDRVWRELRKKLEELDAADAGVKVGVLSSGPEREEGDGVSMVELAAIHEFGAPRAGIPERSFIRRAMRENEGALARVMTRVARQIINDDLSIAEALEVLGHWGVSAIKATIKSGVTPELAPATIARKKSSKPLVDTGQLINAITFAIKGRGNDKRGRGVNE
jgi:hypothetical protein